jgi:N-acetylneuraminic acid mutarotase
MDSSNAVSKGRDLLAVGGYTLTSKIYGYSFASDSWVHIGDMPRQLFNSGIHVLPSSDMLVLGGAQSEGIRDFTPRVYRLYFKGT